MTIFRSSSRKLAVLAFAILVAIPFAARAEKVRIAFIDPFSGPLGVLGKTGISAFRSSEEVLQEARQASANQLEFVEFDNKFSPTETLLQLKSAIDQGFRYVDTTNEWAGRDDLATLREIGGSARPLAFNCRPNRRTA